MGTSVRKSLFGILFLRYFAFASTVQKEIPAVSGQNINVTCRAPNNNTITAAECKRSDLGDIYMFLYRQNHIDTNDQHPSFKNRVDLQDRQMKDGDVSLILKNVTINDTGTYECCVSIKETSLWESFCNFTLTVVDPPGQTGGDTEDGGKKDGGKEDGSVGLKVVCAVGAIVAAAVVVVVGFLIYRKVKPNKYQPAVKLQPV
ncbi:programmed cell death 1 ligand 1-like [Pelmatolapia mariae]|uniref:programmed cell death 1 ligand 1-like n=1 Tax=Pelmatolapia mariae TaxID=158779 RepID=UPI002FE69063